MYESLIDSELFVLRCHVDELQRCDDDDKFSANIHRLAFEMRRGKEWH